MIALRNIRHDAMNAIDAAKKDKNLGEDEAKRLASRIDDVMGKAKTDVDAAAKAKESEIMTV